MLKHFTLRSVQTALLLTVVTVLVGAFGLQAVESKLTKDELKSQVANAKTAQDHQRLAAHFTAQADELDAEAKEHTELAGTYRAHPTIHEMKHQMSGQTAGHCDYFAKEIKSILAREHIVRNHDVRPQSLQHGQRFLDRRTDRHFPAIPLQIDANIVGQYLVILDDQHTF